MYAGTALSLPQGYRGAVLTAAPGEQTDKTWHVEGTFSELRYWNHETAPTKTDGLPRCLEWLKISTTVLTKPVQFPSIISNP